VVVIVLGIGALAHYYGKWTAHIVTASGFVTNIAPSFCYSFVDRKDLDLVVDANPLSLVFHYSCGIRDYLGGSTASAKDSGGRSEAELRLPLFCFRAVTLKQAALF
jgi:hypothetical protein